MVTALLCAALVLAAPEVTVTAPDTVETGAVFTVEIRIAGGDLSSARCNPESTGGLSYLGSSTMTSFSTVTTSGGTQMVSEMILTMSFSAPAQGLYEVGPFTFSAVGTGRMELPELSIVSVGAGQGGTHGTSSHRQRTSVPDPQPDEPIAWVEVSIDTSGTAYPGCPFQASYFLCTRNSTIWSVNYRVNGSDYASSRTLESPPDLTWRRRPDGIRQALLATLEIIPAFPCSLTLPLIRGVVTLRSGFIETEYDLSGDTAWVPVMPFPLERQPADFTGLADSVSISLSRTSGGYSIAAERCMNLEVSGPGASLIEEPPPLTVTGPASIRLGPREENEKGDRVVWLVLVQPSDSGTVVLGPDSLAWFDRTRGEYSQAILPACTLTVRAPVRSIELPVIDTGSGDGDAVLPWVLGIPALSCLVFAILRIVRKRGAGSSIAEAGDAEELLTALEGELCLMLTGMRGSMGFEELGEELDDAGIDNILSRRLLRQWKDLEMCLSGRALSEEQLMKLKRNTTELLEELAAEIRSLRG